MKVVVSGMIASFPVGGVLWDYGHYALGLERMGFEVYYLEDTSVPAYDPNRQMYHDDCSYGVRFLESELSRLSPTLGRRWHYRNITGDCYGLTQSEMADVMAEAVLFLNVSGGTLLRDEYMKCLRKVLIDTDPGWNQFRNYPQWDTHPNWGGTHGYRAHDFFFTYAQRIGQPDCVIPSLGLPWQPTRPLVVMDCWQPEPPAEKWTTVMAVKSWSGLADTVEYQGVKYGAKEIEFARVQDLPRHCRAALEVAAGGKAPREEWQELGWSVVEAQAKSATADAYRHYIQSSRAEFSVAKNVYVATGSGWFSCRSICYLAAGRPVVVQDTGFSKLLPVGQGVLTFANREQAAVAINTVEENYAAHARAAREVAARHFAAPVVLGEILERVGL